LSGEEIRDKKRKRKKRKKRKLRNVEGIVKKKDEIVKRTDEKNSCERKLDERYYAPGRVQEDLS